jgi:hypothetical protein
VRAQAPQNVLVPEVNPIERPDSRYAATMTRAEVVQSTDEFHENLQAEVR